MTSFSITPVAEFPPASADDFPNYIQFQADGADLGGPDVDTVNFVGNLRATRGTGEATATVTVEATATVTVEGVLLSWRETDTDTTLLKADGQNGLAVTANTGEVFITVPADTGGETLDFATGQAVLVFQQGGARVTVVGESGVLLQYRAALTNSLAGEFATATLIKRAADTWVLCGDLELA